MPNEAGPALEVRYTSEFKRNVRQLAKKYRRIKNDLKLITDSLEKGETPGDEIPGTGADWVVFKARAANSDSGRGKSGGYRVIYALQEGHPVVLITVYSKSEQGDVRPNVILQIIKDFGDATDPELHPSTEE